jgi:nucleotide-binding universal stress UspA family protein
VPAEPVVSALSVDSRHDGHITRAARQLLANAAAYAMHIAPGVRVSVGWPDGPAPRQFTSMLGSPALVVVGHTDGDSFDRSPFGSTGLAIIAATSCPAVVVRTDLDWHRPESAPVVLGFGDEYPGDVTEDVLDFAFRAASDANAPLVAVEAGDNHETTDLVRRFWNRYPQIRVCRHIVGDQTSRALIDWTRGARLLVLGCQPDEALGVLAPGSAARTAVDSAACPTVLIRSRLAAVAQRPGQACGQNENMR